MHVTQSRFHPWFGMRENELCVGCDKMENGGYEKESDKLIEAVFQRFDHEQKYPIFLQSKVDVEVDKAVMMMLLLL